VPVGRAARAGGDRPLLDEPGLPATVQLAVRGRPPRPAALLGHLQESYGVVSVLLEGGPTLAGAFVAQGLVDRVVGYVAPALLGDGPHALGAAGAGTITAAHRLRLDDVTRVGDDVRLDDEEA
jgi:diaminohydroxyphosphoribosylaminopyrimidine deaminase/5-amino-6-(5-phosphoribosylamino)uracil reductase